MEQAVNDLLQRAEQYSLQIIRVRGAEGRLAGMLVFANSLSSRQIKGVLGEISVFPGRALASSVALPEKNVSRLRSESCQVTVEERMQLFGGISKQD